MGSINDFVFNIGIAKRLDSDVIFHEIKEDPVLIDRMLITSPYKFRMSTIPKFMGSIMSEIAFREELRSNVEQIIQEANNKRHELYELMKQNPFLPFHKLISRYMYGCYFGMIGSFLRIPMFSCCLATFIFLLTGHAFIFVFMVSFAVACLFDFFTCRLFSSRGSPQEIEWLESMMKQHPELNTLEIDREIKVKLEQLATTLMAKYSTLSIEYNKSMEKHDDHHCHYDDKFILRMRRKVTSSIKGSPTNSERTQNSSQNSIVTIV